MIDDFDEIKFVAKLEYDGWKKERQIGSMLPNIQLAVIKEIHSLMSIEENPPTCADLETIVFRLEEIESIVIKEKVKTYYMKYIRR